MRFGVRTPIWFDELDAPSFGVSRPECFGFRWTWANLGDARLIGRRGRRARTERLEDAVSVPKLLLLLLRKG